MFREIGPTAAGATASSPTDTTSLRRVAPSSTSTSAATTIVAIPQSAISALNAAL